MLAVVVDLADASRHSTHSGSFDKQAALGMMRRRQALEPQRLGRSRRNSSSGYACPRAWIADLKRAQGSIERIRTIPPRVAGARRRTRILVAGVRAGAVRQPSANRAHGVSKGQAQATCPSLCAPIPLSAPSPFSPNSGCVARRP